ncbi:MAG: 23S rRNA (adenine(1618)-N(6))-methyltransferase RlmF [Schleiferiaceae bacterium]
MASPKKERPQIKSALHPKNPFNRRYDFEKLTASFPDLKPFVRKNDYGDLSIDFFDPKAVLTLNKALLKYYYQINRYHLPVNYLAPPIPGRADYLFYANDLLASDNNTTEHPVRCLDVGVGANCIYPIIGSRTFGWSFVGSDIDGTSIKNAQKIVKDNDGLFTKIDIRFQKNKREIFNGVVKRGEKFDLSLCNPPFHSSAAQATQSGTQKYQNLKKSRRVKPVSNFGGQANELWTYGGEERFIAQMISESKSYGSQVRWFTCLLSKSKHINRAVKAIEESGAVEHRLIEMSQGNKSSRFLAWTFLTERERSEWKS